MSGIATAIVGTAVVGAYATHEAGKASERGAETQAQAQREGTALSVEAQREQLEYLKEVNKLPQQYREEALTQLSQRTQPGGVPSQTERIGLAKESPLYAEIMGSREAGEEGILRGAAATGGLRSGNVQENLYDYNVGLQNTALTQAYGQQQSEEAQKLAELQNLAGLNTGSAQVAQTMGNIGTTQMQGAIGAGTALSQGQIAQGQIYQQGMQGLSNTALTGLSLGIQAGKI